MDGNMIDALPREFDVAALVKRRTHPHAQQLAEDLEGNPDLWDSFVGEVFWLKKRGRPGAVKDLSQWLRKKSEFTCDARGSALLVRLVILCYARQLNTAMFELRNCTADAILGTEIVDTPKGRRLVASPELLEELAALGPVPSPRKVSRRSARRVRVSQAEAAATLPFIKEIIAGSPHPKSRRLLLWARHARAQPEVFALLMRKLKKLPRRKFSILGELAHAKKTAMRSSDTKKRFTMDGKIACLYCCAAMRRFPRLWGWTQFVEHHQGRKQDRALILLACGLADKPVNGELFSRLKWARDHAAE
jgi:hypothetical protein